MAYIKTYKCDENIPNFLASEIGLITKTRQFDDTDIEADEFGNKSIKAGAIYPANDGTAEGIVFENVDVTKGEHAGSIVIAGRVFEDRLQETLTSEAKEVLKANGIIFDKAAETVR